MKPQNIAFSGNKKSPKNSHWEAPSMGRDTPDPPEWNNQGINPSKGSSRLWDLQRAGVPSTHQWVTLGTQHFHSSVNKIGKWQLLWANFCAIHKIEKHITLEQRERRTGMVATKKHLHTANLHQTGANTFCILKTKYLLFLHMYCVRWPYRCKQACTVLLSINKYLVSSKQSWIHKATFS